MDNSAMIQSGGFLWSPAAFGMLVSLAIAVIWLAFRPARKVEVVQQRLDDYLEGADLVEETELRRPLSRRLVVPLLRRLLPILGSLGPKRNIETLDRMLLQAGSPAGLRALDFVGLQLLLLLVLAGGYFFLLGPELPFAVAVRNSLIMGALGFFGPRLWLRRRVRRRQHEVALAFPDALDMMTIGVEAGLAFESAMLKVGEQWDNALTRELRRAVTEMRVGTPRNAALERMVERLGVPEVGTFVTVLIQSNQLGMSIAQVLHAQADEMRVKRRQRAEELARQAGGKMVFPLVFCFIPALFIVILGPGMPELAEFMKMMSTMNSTPVR